jgi:hypothetical protein
VTFEKASAYGEACAKAAREDAASWERQASDRVDDALRFAREADEWKAKALAMEEDLLVLQKFTDSIIGEFPDIGDIDGFALQDIAEAYGLLVKESTQVPCGDHCACAEVVDEGKTTECMRVQPVLQRARRAAIRALSSKEAEHG